MSLRSLSAEVIAVFPDKVRISVDDITDFSIAEEKLRVGSYLRISDNDNAVMIAIIENFSLEVPEVQDGKGRRRYILEATPLGIIRDGKFERGGETITIPPKKVEPAGSDEIKTIYATSLDEKRKFEFSKLSSNPSISVHVDGDKFFNKHIAIVGSTGSGKSHAVAKIIQNATQGKNSSFEGLNNSHVIIFDIHSEYKAAFPKANFVDINNLRLPYWLMNGDELQELFIETEVNDHNQRNVFKDAVIKSKIDNYDGDGSKIKIHFDYPTKFDINDVLHFVNEKNNEKFDGARGKVNGPLYGKLSNFVNRLESKLADKRMKFLLSDESRDTSFEEVMKMLMGYGSNNDNVTIIDLSGVPFEVLSITVSLISRILFEYGYYYKRLKVQESNDENEVNDVPLLLVYEEAHKYVPNKELSKYRASR